MIPLTIWLNMIFKMLVLQVFIVNPYHILKVMMLWQKMIYPDWEGDVPFLRVFFQFLTVAEKQEPGKGNSRSRHPPKAHVLLQILITLQSFSTLVTSFSPTPSQIFFMSKSWASSPMTIKFCSSYIMEESWALKSRVPIFNSSPSPPSGPCH